MRSAAYLALLALPRLLAAQASSYVPLDDPRLPAFEHLVARGDVADPSPQLRPFRRADALGALATADTAGAPSRRLIQELRAAWVQDTGEAAWSLAARIGADAATMDGRDPLHPTGNGSLLPYGELFGTARFGPFVATSRNAIEPRLTDDPDWHGRQNLKVIGRTPEAYLSGQWRWARLFYGMMDRQWGPAGVPGIPVSAYGYPRTDLGFEVGTDRLRITALAAELTDDADSTGARVHRYWFAHRLTIVPSRRLAVALWETTVIGGADRNFDARWRNPAAVLFLADQYGLGADGNIMIGSDVTWWARSHLRLEGQFALDDLNYPDPGSKDHTPSRYAFTVAASGPALRTASWKALYTQASSLAFQTKLPYEHYVDAGTGLGRGYAGADQASFFLAIPVGSAALITPELTLLRQGEGELTDSFPTLAAHNGQVPTIFRGVVERTLRAALGVSGARGDLRLAGNVGVHHLQNADHIVGRTRNDIVAQARITFSFAGGGHLE